jgi:hypothetical protein
MIAETTVADLGIAVAAEIEREGHWQGFSRSPKGMSIATGRCILLNSLLASPYREDGTPYRDNGPFVDMWPEFSEAISKRAGLTSPNSVYFWNDTTPTAEVLDVLRSL